MRWIRSNSRELASSFVYTDHYCHPTSCRAGWVRTVTPLQFNYRHMVFFCYRHLCLTSVLLRMPWELTGRINSRGVNRNFHLHRSSLCIFKYLYTATQEWKKSPFSLTRVLLFMSKMIHNKQHSPATTCGSKTLIPLWIIQLNWPCN